MKYFNGFQAKEIPIIFRGGIEAGDPAGDPIERSFSSVYTSTMGEGVMITDSIYDDELLDIDTLHIEEISFSTNGGTPVRYSNPPVIKIEEENQYAFGSIFDFDTGEFSNPDFPFSLVVFEDYNDDEELVTLYYLVYSSGGKKGNTKSAADYTDVAFIGTIGGSGVAIPAKKTMQFELTGNGSIKRFYVRFAVGENGTLHINPYVILNGNIRIDLCNFADGGFKYINGDDETISFDCYVPVETHALACIDIENVGGFPSIIDAAMVVSYEDFIEPESIVGYEGINLKR